MYKFLKFIVKHELFLSVFLFGLSIVFMLINKENLNWITSLPLVLTWFAALLFGDYLNRKTNQGGVLTFAKSSRVRLWHIVLASLFMNIISDFTGSWISRLWYYPNLNMYLYFTVLAPIGYILFGLILYIFYRLFKNNLDFLVKRGRTSNRGRNLFRNLMRFYPILGALGLFFSFYYFFDLASSFDFHFLNLNQTSGITVDIIYFVINWLGLFFLFEYICYLQGKINLTWDILRGNWIPILSILIASVCIIILIEYSNSPFQVWVFDNWPLNHVRLFEIPLYAYLAWPMQYLLLLPILRILDNKNTENIY